MQPEDKKKHSKLGGLLKSERVLQVTRYQSMYYEVVIVAKPWHEYPPARTCTFCYIAIFE